MTGYLGEPHEPARAVRSATDVVRGGDLNWSAARHADDPGHRRNLHALSGSGMPADAQVMQAGPTRDDIG